jgi:hypothetical protein
MKALPILKSLNCNPSNPQCLGKYADLLYHHGNHAEAGKFFELARRHSELSGIKQEELYENERRHMFQSEFSKENLIPLDYRVFICLNLLTCLGTMEYKGWPY